MTGLNVASLIELTLRCQYLCHTTLLFFNSRIMKFPSGYGYDYNGIKGTDASLFQVVQ